MISAADRPPGIGLGAGAELGDAKAGVERLVGHRNAVVRRALRLVVIEAERDLGLLRDLTDEGACRAELVILDAATARNLGILPVQVDARREVVADAEVAVIRAAILAVGAEEAGERVEILAEARLLGYHVQRAAG